MKTIITLKPYQHGQLKDGRHYKILAIPQIVITKSGELQYGDIELNISDTNGKDYISVMRISEFLDNVINVGNLFI